MTGVVAVPLGQLCVPTSQCDPAAYHNDEFIYIDIASVDRDSKLIVNPQSLLGTNAPSRARKKVKAGDVIVSTVRPNLNAVALVPPNLDGSIASTGYTVLRPDPDRLLSSFLFHYVRCPFFVDYLVSRCTGANYPAVSDSTVKSVPIAVLPLPEQHHVVRILDEADELRKLRAKADERTGDLIPAVFHDMFGDVIGSGSQWPGVTVAKAGTVQLGRQRAPKYQTGLFTRPYVRVANVFEDEIDISDILSMDFGDKDFRGYRLEHGDILLNEGQSTELVGRPAMWREEVADCCFQNTLVRFKANSGLVEPVFALSVFLDYFRRGEFARISSKTSNVAHLGAGRFANMPFPLPPIELQREFAARVEEVRSMQEQQSASRKKLGALFESLLHRAFAGEL